MDDIAIARGGGAQLPPEFAAQEEESFDMPAEDLIKHSNWKARKQGWEQVLKEFTENKESPSAECFQRFGGAMRAGAKDANPAALEAALQAALVYFDVVGKSVQDIEAVLNSVCEKGLTGRPKAAGIAQNILLTAVEQGFGSEVIDAAETHLQKAKAPKQKQAFSGVIEKVASEFGMSAFPDQKQILRFAGRCLNEKDDKTKKSGRAIGHVLFLKMSESLYKVLEVQKEGTVKPGDVEELKKYIKASEDKTPVATRALKGQELPSDDAEMAGGGGGGGAGAATNMAYDFAPVKQVIKNLPKDFISQWSGSMPFPAREELYNDSLHPHISQIKLDPSENYRDLVSALKLTLADNNAGVVQMTLRAITNISNGLRSGFAPSGRILFAPVLDKLKEKKKAVLEQAHAALFAFYEHSIVCPSDVNDACVASADTKMPHQRQQTLVWIARSVAGADPELAARSVKTFATCIMKNAEHSDAGCRTSAVEAAVAVVRVLGVDACKFLSSLPAAAREKIMKQADAEGGGAVAPMGAKPGRTTPSPRGGVESARAKPGGKGAAMRSASARQAKTGIVGRSDTPPPSAGGQRDLRNAPDIVAKLQDDNWRKREAGLKELGQMCQGQTVRGSDISSDLISQLKVRLTDKNKNLIPLACETVTQLTSASGASARSFASEFVPALATLLADQKPPVRTAARSGLSEFGIKCGPSGLLPHYPKAMSTEVSLARQALCELLTEVLERPGTKLKRGELSDIVRPLVNFLQDRVSATRQSAEAVLKYVIDNVGYETVKRHVEQLQPSNQRALQPVLDKNRQGLKQEEKRVDPSGAEEALRRVGNQMNRPGSAIPARQQNTPAQMQIDDDAPARTPFLGEDSTPVIAAHRNVMLGARIDSAATAIAFLERGEGSTKANCPDADDAVYCIKDKLKMRDPQVNGTQDRIVLVAIKRMHAVFDDPDATLLAARPTIDMLTALFLSPLATQVSCSTLVDLIADILWSLLTSTLHGDNQKRGRRTNSEDILRDLNALMLKILECANRVNCFEAIIQLMDRYTKLADKQGDEQHLQYCSLVVKCAMKLTHLVRTDLERSSNVDFVALLTSLHNFLKNNPPSAFQDEKKKCDISLRTVKTILNEFVKMKSSKILDALSSIPGDTSLIQGFVRLCLDKAQSTDEPRAGGGQVAAGSTVSESDRKQLDDMFLKIRKTETTKEGVQELSCLLRTSPALDIGPWLLQCSKPFQSYVLRQLRDHGITIDTTVDATHCGSEPTSSTSVARDAREASDYTATGDIQSIRERMQSVRQQRSLQSGR